MKFTDSWSAPESVRAAKRIVRKFLNHRVWYGSLGVASRLLSVHGEQPLLDKYSLIVPTQGRGNTGDQAMLEAMLLNLPGKKVVVTTSAEDFQPMPDARQVEFVVLPKLLNGRSPGHIVARRVFAKLLTATSHLYVIGADIMDGGYSREESVLRSQLVLDASAQGVAASVVGFSFGKEPDPIASSYLRKVGRVAKLWARDPLSLERMKKAGINAEQSTDLVFSHPGLARASALLPTEGTGKLVERPKVVLNISGLIAGRVDLDAQYVSIVRFLVANGYRVVILPHVIRHGDDDLQAAESVYTQLSEDNAVEIASRARTPAEVAQLVAGSEFCITGRMHLAIICLTQGVVPITLATQGKVEGLAAMFDIGDLVVEPKEDLDSNLIALIGRIVTDPEKYKLRIRDAIIDVRGLSLMNYV